MKNISTDIYTFEDLIKNGCLYVDKTKYVWNIVSRGSSIFFLSRPRRFGKSLLLSTFKAYFEGKKELFSGLELEKLKSDEWETYPVIHLDLAIGSSRVDFDSIVRRLKQQVRDSAKNLGVDIDEGSPADMLHNLIYGAKEKYDKKVVILIDEYDKPILDSISEPYIKDVIKIMSDFYQELKSANDIERFVFITGVTKFAHVSLFSGANNPIDISKNEKYATMLGYTEKELQDNFGEYIDEISEKRRIPRDILLSHVKLWYNGSRFVSGTESVYNPVSVGCFFDNKRFDNYWVTTGVTRVMLNKIKETPFCLREFSSTWIYEETNEKYELDQIGIEELAIQTGYLTIVDWKETEDYRYKVRYDFPNKEVRDCWYKNIITLSTNRRSELWSPLMDKMCDALNSQDLESLMESVKNFFSGIPYENAGEITEGYFRNQLHTLFTLFGIPNQCEVQQASQRADIVAQTRKMAVVFELKMLDKDVDGDELKIHELIEAAKNQARQKGYADKYKNESETTKTVAVVFDEKTRKMVKWEDADF